VVLQPAASADEEHVMARVPLTLLAAVVAVAPARAACDRLASIPDADGFAGAFAGTAGGTLLVAGGSNFPGRKPWEGGTKVWHDTVFALDQPGGPWRVVGKLPRPMGYGVCASDGQGVVCVGGGDADRNFADAFRLTLRAGQLVTTPLPSLPRPMANGCGAMVGRTLYVAGGQETPTATRASAEVFAIDLSAAAPAWRAIPPCPGGGRILATAAAVDGAFWIAGGAALDPTGRRYVSDAWRYDHGWRRVADLPHPVVAAPSPAATDVGGFFVLGGDDGSQVGVPHDRHRGFGRSVLRYDAKADRWTPAGDYPAGAVTAPLVPWRGTWVIPNGEVRPGVRSPLVWAWTPATKVDP
jgi:N-acetylneuraminate epimerase